jgi:hypothetical protein
MPAWQMSYIYLIIFFLKNSEIEYPFNTHVHIPIIKHLFRFYIK